jgi:hypothetical protein
MKAYVILGAGGMAREVFWHIREADTNARHFVFVDDVTQTDEISFPKISKSPVVKDWNFDPYKDSIIGEFSGETETKRYALYACRVSASRATPNHQSNLSRRCCVICQDHRRLQPYSTRFALCEEDIFRNNS